MRYLVIILSLLIASAFIGNVTASPPGKTVEFEDTWAGKVIFNGDTHGAKQGMKCPDCHPSLFPMKKAPKGTYTMDDMVAGKNCGACHNGEKAFSSDKFEDCGKCHMQGEAKTAEVKEEETEEAEAEPEESK